MAAVVGSCRAGVAGWAGVGDWESVAEGLSLSSANPPSPLKPCPPPPHFCGARLNKLVYQTLHLHLRLAHLHSVSPPPLCGLPFHAHRDLYFCQRQEWILGDWGSPGPPFASPCHAGSLRTPARAAPVWPTLLCLRCTSSVFYADNGPATTAACGCTTARWCTSSWSSCTTTSTYTSKWSAAHPVVCLCCAISS